MKTFYEKFNSLRAAAAIMFDKCLASDIPKEQIGSHIQPLYNSLEILINNASKYEVGQIGLTIKTLEHNINSWRETEVWCRLKIDQEFFYLNRLKQALFNELKSRKTDHIACDGMIITISSDEKGIEIR